MTTNNEIAVFVERLARLIEEQLAIAANLKEVLEEAGGKGLDKALLRRIARMKVDAKTEARELKQLELFPRYLEAAGYPS